MFQANIKTYLQENAGVSEQEANLLEKFFVRKEVKKGTFLLREGEVCKHSIFVEKGLLRMYSIDGNGKEHIIQFAPENWFVTDRGSVFFGEPSRYFIDAIEDTTIVFLDQNFMCEATSQTSGFGAYNERILQKHIMHLQRRVNLLIGASAEDRYMDFIKQYPDILLRVPQWMIASYLGITPESLSRVRKDLAKRNA